MDNLNESNNLYSSALHNFFGVLLNNSEEMDVKAEISSNLINIKTTKVSKKSEASDPQKMEKRTFKKNDASSSSISVASNPKKLGVIPPYLKKMKQKNSSLETAEKLKKLEIVELIPYQVGCGICKQKEHFDTTSSVSNGAEFQKKSNGMGSKVVAVNRNKIEKRSSKTSEPSQSSISNASNPRKLGVIPPYLNKMKQKNNSLEIAEKLKKLQKRELFKFQVGCDDCNENFDSTSSVFDGEGFQNKLIKIESVYHQPIDGSDAEKSLILEDEKKLEELEVEIQSLSDELKELESYGEEQMKQILVQTKEILNFQKKIEVLDAKRLENELSVKDKLDQIKKMESKLKSFSKYNPKHSDLQAELNDLKSQKEILAKERCHIETVYGDIYSTKILSNLIAVKNDLVEKLSANDLSCKMISQNLSEKVFEYLKKANLKTLKKTPSQQKILILFKSLAKKKLETEELKDQAGNLEKIKSNFSVTLNFLDGEFGMQALKELKL